MRVDHHPDDSTIMAYAAGAMTEGLNLVVAAHTELCTKCQRRVDEAEGIGGAVLSDLPDTAMAPSSMSAVWDRIEASGERKTTPRSTSTDSAGLPSVLRPCLPEGLDGIRWRTLAPGIKRYELRGIDAGRGNVLLLSIAPGTVLPQHSHGGCELTLVLRGSFVDEFGRFKAGDIADADPSTRHQPVADTNETCICLIATDDRLRFTNVVNRVLQPFVGL